MDLEMPGPAPEHEEKIVNEIRRGILPEKCLDRAAVRVTKLALRSAAVKKGEYRYDQAAHQTLARKAAASSMVLLKNEDDILPLKSMKSPHPMKDGNAKDSVAIIGAMAKYPKFQGAGSSQVHPSAIENAFDELDKQGVQLLYAQGYPYAPQVKDDPAKSDFSHYIDEACSVAQKCDIALVFVGIPDEEESEGFDRENLRLPMIHEQLISAVAKVQPNTVVILHAGAPVLMPWEREVKGILLAYLSGQAGGGAVADILTGKSNPSGKLAETFPLTLQDIPSRNHFNTGARSEEYRESIYIGYRYYDTAHAQVLFPFGHGLSYTKFSYEDLRITNNTFEAGNQHFLSLTLTVRNIGETAGAEMVQLYVRAPKSKYVFRPKKELKDFGKVYLEPGEAKELTFRLDDTSFAYYHFNQDDNPAKNGWAVEGGEYKILLASSCQDIRLETVVTVTGDGREKDLSAKEELLPYYFYPVSGGMDAPKKQFELLYGSRLPSVYRHEKTGFTVDDTVRDIENTFVGKVMTNVMEKQFQKITQNAAAADQKMMEAAMWETPMRAIPMFANGKVMQRHMEGVVEMANGHYLRGIQRILRKENKK
jgi:beta-glucosidase